MPLLPLLNNKLVWLVIALLGSFGWGWYLGSSSVEKDFSAYKDSQEQAIFVDRLSDTFNNQVIKAEYEKLIANLPPTTVPVTERLYIRATCPVPTSTGAGQGAVDRTKVELSEETDRRIRELGNEAEIDKIRLLKLQKYVKTVCLNTSKAP